MLRYKALKKSKSNSLLYIETSLVGSLARKQLAVPLVGSLLHRSRLSLLHRSRLPTEAEASLNCIYIWKLCSSTTSTHGLPAAFDRTSLIGTESYRAGSLEPRSPCSLGAV
jgi:hypothetical protein